MSAPDAKAIAQRNAMKVPTKIAGAYSGGEMIAWGWAFSPTDANATELERRYRALGGDAEIVVLHGLGQTKCGHDGPERYDSARLVEFFPRRLKTVAIAFRHARIRTVPLGTATIFRPENRASFTSR